MEVPVSLLFQFPTVASLAPELEQRFLDVDVTALAAELEKLTPEEIDQLLDDASRKPAL
jgi:hypothetical protein